MTLKGTLRHRDIGMGVWELIEPSGRVVQLDGDVDDALDGQSARVTGTLSELHGTAMTGATHVLRLSGPVCSQ